MRGVYAGVTVDAARWARWNLAVSDALRGAMRRAHHWANLGWAEAWEQVARGLDGSGHAATARLAWRWAWDGYEAYREEYQRNLPASRWDHDFGPERVHARDRATARTVAVDDGAPLPAWMVAALAGRLEEAVAAVPARVDDPTERQAVRALTIALGAAKRDDQARQLAVAAGLVAPTDG
jgi:hypothetical protein